MNAGTPIGVHYLAFNSETTAVSAAELAAMTAFMRSDLASVSRARTPWVVAFSHKHWWMDGTDVSRCENLPSAHTISDPRQFVCGVDNYNLPRPSTVFLPLLHPAGRRG